MGNATVKEYHDSWAREVETVVDSVAIGVIFAVHAKAYAHDCSTRRQAHAKALVYPSLPPNRTAPSATGHTPPRNLHLRGARQRSAVKHAKNSL